MGIREKCVKLLDLERRLVERRNLDLDLAKKKEVYEAYTAPVGDVARIILFIVVAVVCFKIKPLADKYVYPTSFAGIVYFVVRWGSIVMAVVSWFGLGDYKKRKQNAKSQLQAVEEEMQERDKLRQEHAALQQELMQIKKTQNLAGTLFFEAPFNEKTAPVNYKLVNNPKSHFQVQAGALKLYQDNDKFFVDGFEEKPEMDFSQLEAFIASEDHTMVYADVEYLTGHNEESYRVALIYDLMAVPEYQKEIRYKDKLIDVEKSMEKYREELDSLERLFNSGHTNEELWSSNKLELADYNIAKSYREYAEKTRKQQMQSRNAYNTVETTKAVAVNYLIKSCGVVVKNKNEKVVLISVPKYHYTWSDITCALPAAMDIFKLNETMLKAVKGEIVSFKNANDMIPVDYLRIFLYILQEFGRELDGFDPLRPAPYHTSAEVWREWITCYYHYNRLR